MGRRPYLLANGIHSQGATPLMAMQIVLTKTLSEKNPFFSEISVPTSDMMR
jgi:hypothetical protein